MTMVTRIDRSKGKMMVFWKRAVIVILVSYAITTINFLYWRVGSVQKNLREDNTHSSLISSKKRLEFVHITKNGGSAIEKVAAEKGIIWGACHYMNITEVGCYGTDIPYIAPNYQSFALTSPWHTPPKILRSRVKPTHNPYTGADLFAVVRNPYSRVISEYYCPWTGIRKQRKKGNGIDDPDVMNKWVTDMVGNLDNILSAFNAKSPDDRPKEQGPGLNEDAWLLAQKHFVNQAEYFFDNKTQIIDNVIHYESIQKDFDELMRKYSLDLQLPDKESHGVNKGGSKGKLSHLDLYPETIAVINKYAGVDFKTFGYKMVDSFDNHQDYSLFAVK